MSGFELPQNLVREMAERDAASSARRAWMVDLPWIVDDLARRWSLRLGRPFQPGGVASWVASARDVAGEPVVLKVGWRHDEALHEADGLRAWEGRGAVRLLDTLLVGQTSALLLEDPTYDPLQHMLNFPDRLAADPTGFAQRMADLLDLDANRLRQWLFARCVQESIDQPYLRSAAIELAP